MTLRIDVLGTPRIEVDGEPLGVDTRKATALLAYLAVTGGVHGRDLLVDLLWPDAEPDRGRAALRRTLSTLRSALGGRWLDAGRAAVGLELEDDAIDVRRFRALVASAGGGAAGIRPLTTAVMLHRDDLLAGFGLRDSVAFDDWQRAAAGTLRGELEIALDRLVGALAEAGRADEAIAHCQRRLALDPLHEPAHRSLIRLYAASGHRAEALSQYRQCVRVLDRELGVRPLPETSELYDAVNEGARRRVAGRAARRPRAAARARPAAGRPGRRVGRAREEARPVPRRRAAGRRRGRARRRQDPPGRGAAGRRPRRGRRGRRGPLPRRRGGAAAGTGRGGAAGGARGARRPTRLRPSPTTGGARLRAWFPRWAASPLPGRTTWRRSSGCTRG